MIPLKLKLTNFISHKETEIDFTPLKAVCLYGENGSGKTSIIDGILYALYSYTSRGRDDSLIRLGESKMKVEFTFEIDGSLYQVVKEKELGKSKTSSLYKLNGGDPSLIATGERVDEYIETLLGMNYDTFTSTFFLLQDNAYKFILSTPAERYRILFNILGLDIYQDYKKIASSFKKEADGKRELLESQISEKQKIVSEKEALKKELQNITQEFNKVSKDTLDLEKIYIEKEKELSAISAKIKELQKITTRDIETESRAIKDKIAQYQNALKMKPQVEQAAKAKSDLNNKLLEVFNQEKEALVEYDRLKALYNEVLNKENEKKIKIEQIDSKIKEYKLKFEQAKKNLQDYQKVSSLLDQVPCKGVGEFASCTLISNAIESKNKIPSIQSAVIYYENEAKKLEQEKENLSNELISIIKEKEQIAIQGKTATQKIKEIQNLKETLTKQIENLDKLLNMQALIASAEKGIEAEKEKLKLLEEEKTKIQQIKQEENLLIKQHSELTLKINELKEKINLFKIQENELLRRKTSVENMLAVCIQAEEEIKTLNEQLSRIKRKVHIFSILEEAYEKIPKIIFTNYINSLENKVNEILSKISSTGMQVELVTEKQTKTTKAVKNTLEITVFDTVGERRIENYSGGEKTRLTLAFTVALSELASKKSGQRILTLAIDEPPGLDIQGYKDFALAINQLINEHMFAKCIVISHSGELIDEFEQKIRVEKINGASSIQIKF